MGRRAARVPHVLVMLYAVPGELDAWLADRARQCAAGFEQMACLSTSDLDGDRALRLRRRHLAAARSTGSASAPARDEEQLDYTNLSCLGEYLLGYPNEYGAYTDRPLLDPLRDPGAHAARAPRTPRARPTSAATAATS